MKCLNCSREISNNQLTDKTNHPYYKCQCGVKYSPEILLEYQSDKNKTKEYEHIRHWRLFKVKRTDCGKIIIMHTLKDKKTRKGKIVHPLHYKLHQFLERKGWIKT